MRPCPEEDSLRHPARLSWIVPAAVGATIVVIGATLSGIGSPRGTLNGGIAVAGGRALVGGPTALHTQSSSRYASPTNPYAGPTKDIACDVGSMPETVQGKVAKADYTSGRAAKGYFCNARMVS